MRVDLICGLNRRLDGDQRMMKSGASRKTIRILGGKSPRRSNSDASLGPLGLEIRPPPNQYPSRAIQWELTIPGRNRAGRTGEGAEICAGASARSGARSRLVSRVAAMLRLSVLRRGNHSGVWRQVIRSKTCVVHVRRGALHWRPKRPRIREACHLAACKPGRRQACGGGIGTNFETRRHGGARPDSGYLLGEILSG